MSRPHPSAPTCRPPGVLSRFAAVLLFGALSGNAMAASDEGASHNLLVKISLSEKWFVISRSNLASRDHFDDYFFGYTGAALGYQFNPQWSARAGYRHAWIRPGDRWLDEDRPFAEMYWAHTKHDFRLTHRSRFEFRFFDYRDDDVRYRDETTVEAPWTISPLLLKPYLEEEFFYGFDASRFEANWLGGGLSWRLVDGVKLKLGYRWVHQLIGENWIDRNTVVTGINVYF